MKLRLNRSSVELCTGPVMWTCTNGRKNYRRSFWLSVYSMPSCTNIKYGPWILVPTIAFHPWKRGCLTEIDKLGMSSSSLSIGIDFLVWSFGVRFMISRNSKTQQEIDHGNV